MKESEALALLSLLNDYWPGLVGTLAERGYLNTLEPHEFADGNSAIVTLSQSMRFRPTIADLFDEITEARKVRLAAVPAIGESTVQMTEAERAEAVGMLHDYRARKGSA